MHAVHFGARHKVQFAEEYGGNCNSCHNATDNGQGMEMWDLVKYDHLWGVNNIASEDLGDVDFSFEQETTQDNAFSFEWMHAYYDQMRQRCRCAGNQSAPEPVRQLGDHHRRSGQGPLYRYPEGAG